MLLLLLLLLQQQYVSYNLKLDIKCCFIKRHTFAAHLFTQIFHNYCNCTRRIKGAFFFIIFKAVYWTSTLT